MGTSKFSKSLSCPHPKIISIGILSQSEIFTKHGEKIISKVSILSPFIKYLNGDLVPFRNIYQAWGHINFQSLYPVPNQKTSHGDLVPVKNMHRDKIIFKIFILFPSKKHVNGVFAQSDIFTKHGDKIIFKVSILSQSEIFT